MAVNVRVEYKKIPGKSEDFCMRVMQSEFRKKLGDAGVMHEFKMHQYFESESRRDRRAAKDIANKREQDEIAIKLGRGEKVSCSSKVIKKIRSKQAKEAKAKNRARQRDGEPRFR